jgi:hypothetical protein
MFDPSYEGAMRSRFQFCYEAAEWWRTCRINSKENLDGGALRAEQCAALVCGSRSSLTTELTLHRALASRYF